MRKSLHIILQVTYWIFFLFMIFMLVSASWPEHFPKTIANVLSYIFFSHLTILYFFPSVAGFYVFYLGIFPALLHKKSPKRLLLYGSVFSVLLSVTVWFIKLGGFFIEARLPEFIGAVLLIALMIFANGVIALMIRGFVKWLNDIKKNEELNKKTYDTEIELLKSKINPHFLFNTINNIDVLINSDPVKASQYLNELSDIMRFMLYETKGDHIPLSKELGYIQKYIGLQKIRSFHTEYVTCHISGNADHLSIPPMLFIPYIENAFKYAEHNKSADAIAISIDIRDALITFECRNRHTLSAPNEFSAGGLGNELIKKRLQLLYPGTHTLDITDRDGSYVVKLTLTAYAD